MIYRVMPITFETCTFISTANVQAGFFFNLANPVSGQVVEITIRSPLIKMKIRQQG